MSVIKQVVVPVNLGKTIARENLEALKYDVNIDKATIVADAAGVISAKSTQVAPIIIAGNPIASVADQITGALTPIFETITTLQNVTFDPATSTLAVEYKDEAGAVQVKSTSLAALAVDVQVASAVFDPATFTLTVTESNGDTNTVNLSELVKVATADTATVALTGDGLPTNKLQATVKIDPIAGNLVTATANGLLVDPTAIKGLHCADIELQDAFAVNIGFIHSATTKGCEGGDVKEL